MEGAIAAMGQCGNSPLGCGQQSDQEGKWNVLLVVKMWRNGTYSVGPWRHPAPAVLSGWLPGSICEQSQRVCPRKVTGPLGGLFLNCTHLSTPRAAHPKGFYCMEIIPWGRCWAL